MARSNKSVEDYCHAAIKVSDYGARVGTSLTHELHDKRQRSPDTRIYRFDSSLRLHGEYIYPNTRLGIACTITVYSRDSDDPYLNPTLNAFRETDNEGAAKFRKVRGQLEPIYRVPRGVGLFEKVRGENCWDSAIWVPTHIVTQIAVLLASSQTLYIETTDKKVERKRWLTHLSLGTDNPLDE